MFTFGKRLGYLAVHVLYYNICDRELQYILHALTSGTYVSFAAVTYPVGESTWCKKGADVMFDDVQEFENTHLPIF